MTVYPSQEKMDAMARRAEQAEAEARQSVSRSLSAIEMTLAEWEAAKSRPAALEPTIRYLRFSHGILTRWMKESLSGPRDTLSRIVRIRSCASLGRKLDSQRPV